MLAAKVTAVEVDAAILRLLRAVRVPAAAEVRAAAQAAVQAEAVRGVHRVQAGARVSVRGAERVIALDRVRAGISGVIRQGKAIAAVQEANTRLDRAAEATHRCLNRAKAPEALRDSLLIRQRLGRERKRLANLISQNIRIRKLHGCGMIRIGAGRRR